MKTVGLISLGCPKNLVDSEVMLGLLEQVGYRIVQDPREAQILIVNTCGFIESAKKESIDAILEMGGYKRGAGRCKKLVVAGCLTQRYKAELVKLLPEVDLLIGTGEYQNIVKLLNEPSSHRTIESSHSPLYIHSSATPRKLATPKHAVYLKIAEGCFHACSFCIIPKLRGKFRSRPIDDIAAEAKILLKGGARELNLIAQDTASYGKDLKNGSSLAGLVKGLQELHGDFWIRIMYLYPTSITGELIDVMARSKKVCKYLDIPIQHISDKILTAMRRKERGRDIRNLIENLRSRLPGITLRTSLIVGFPGETKADFLELLNFVKEGHFDHLGVFTYSMEEGTYAAKLDRHLSQKIKEERLNEIMLAQRAVVRKRNKMLIGKIVKVLIDTAALPRRRIVARTEGQAPDIDSVTYIDGAGRLKVGEFANVKITAIKGYDLIGKLC